MQFYENERGSYSLAVREDSGRAYVKFDDGAGGVDFPLREFGASCLIPECVDAFEIAVGDLLAGAVEFIEDGATPTPEPDFIEDDEREAA